MEKNRIYISLFFSFVLLIGTGLSSIHIHIDDFSDTETGHQIVEEDFHCVICGSVLKYSSHTEIVSEAFIHPTSIRYVYPEVSYDSSVTPSFDGRAPPYKA